MKKRQSKKSECKPPSGIPRVIHSWSETNAVIDVRPKYRFGETPDTDDVQDAKQLKKARVDAEKWWMLAAFDLAIYLCNFLFYLRYSFLSLVSIYISASLCKPLT